MMWRKTRLVVALTLLFSGYTAAQRPPEVPVSSHLANVVSFQFVQPLKPPQPPDYRAIKAASDARVAAAEAAQRVLDAQAAQRAADAVQAAQNALQQESMQTSINLGMDSAKLYIYLHESGNNPGAINASSGACGLGQALPCSKMPCSLNDYGCQDAWFTGYAIARYGSWENARAWWSVHSWW